MNLMTIQFVCFLDLKRIVKLHGSNASKKDEYEDEVGRRKKIHITIYKNLISNRSHRKYY